MALPVITIGSVWSTGDQPTAAVLNAKWTAATFASGAVDGVTTALSSDAIIVKDLGVTTAKLAASAVVESKIADLAVTEGKIADNAVTVAKMADHLDLSSNTINLPDGNVTFAQVATAAVATQEQLEDEDPSLLVAANLLKHHPSAAKCYGVVTFDTDSADFSAAYNVSSVLDVSTTTRRVTFLNGMLDANYVVLLTSATNTKEYSVSDRDSAYFDILADDHEAENRTIHFAVFGALA